MAEHPPSSTGINNESFYCPDCNSCGNDGCCNADDCLYAFNHPNCRTHLDHLLYIYKCNKQFIAHIYNQGDKYKELIKEWEEIKYENENSEI
jgi:hypothetical protein